MFALTINHPHASSMTQHPSREVALAYLHRLLDPTGHRLRVAAAAWTHASYEILDHDDHVVGHATIDEICVCTHSARDHEETGCTALLFGSGPVADCGCAGHRPTDTEEGLFATEMPA